MNDPLVKSNFTQTEYFKDIVATVREPLLVLDAGLRVLAANRSFYKTFKVKQKDTLGQQVYDLGNRQWDIPGLRTLLETILSGKAVFNDYEVKHDFPVIGERTLLLNGRRIPAPPKEAHWILLAFEDVSRRRQQERSLQISEQRFHRAFETAHDGMLLIEKMDGLIVNSNQAVEVSLGYSKQSLKKKHLWEIGILKDEEQFRQTISELEAQGLAVGLPDISIPTRSGGNFPADVYLIDKAAVIQCNIHDVSKRKQAEEKLSASENELRALFAAMTDVVIVLDGAGRYLSIAPTNPANLYRPAEDMLGKRLHEVLPKEQADYMLANIRQAIQTNQAVPGEYALPIGGKEIWFASSTTRLSENSVIWVAHDISEYKQAEMALLDSEERFRSLAESALVGTYILQDGIYIYVNPAMAGVFGYTVAEMTGMSPAAIVQPDELAMVGENIRRRIAGEIKAIQFEVRGRNKDGSTRNVEIYGARVDINGKPALVGTLVDITERKRAEEEIRLYREHLEKMVAERTLELRDAQEQLVRKERLAVLGQLAGGVGHELRNPLGVISNSIYYLKMVQPDADEKIQKHHAIIEQEVHNAAHIVSDLLDFARVISTERKAGSVADLVAQALSRFPVPASIQVSLKIPVDLPQVYADPLHVEQMLGNLITNACQSMTRSSLDQSAVASFSRICKLTIRARALVPAPASGPEFLKGSDRPKPMLAISVKDTGTGIIPENMDKLFEALFTTKAKGIGLGLAVSQKLAEANGGSIAAKSQAGRGSTFTLYLPVYRSELGC